MADITYEGIELGFGSPTYNPDDVHDFGFGAPSSITVGSDVYYNSGETGFADPYANIDFQVVTKEYGNFLSDDGGEMLEIRADFNLIAEHFRIREETPGIAMGPFKVYFYEEGTWGNEYYCYAGLDGLSDNIFANTNKKQLFCTTPIMPHGTYKLAIGFEGSLRKIALEPEFTVINRMRNDKTLSIRNNLPRWMKVGDRSDAIQAGEAYNRYAQSNLAILTSSVAELFNHMYHSNYTVTTQQCNSDSTTLRVESTLDFPNSGTVQLQDGQEITYTGKTATTLTGISGNIDIINKNTRVFRRNEDINAVDLFYRLQNNGFYKPDNKFNTANFVKGLNEIDINERSSMQVIWRYFYYLLKKLNYTITTVDANPAGEITNLSETINTAHYGRYCVLDGKVFYIQGGDDTLQELQLDTLGCTYWNSSSKLSSGTYEMEILPWSINEDSDGKFTLEIEKSVFNNLEGYIDRDYIDKDIFLDGLGINNDKNRNLNLDIFVAAGIHDNIILTRRTNEAFGTYFQNDASNPTISVTLDRELEL